MNILFYPVKSKPDKKGLCPLKVRITLSPTDKVEFMSGKKVDPELWDTNKKRMSGKSVTAEVVNKYIPFAENKIMKIHSDLQISEKIITSEIIKNIFQGNDKSKICLIASIDKHNALFEKKIGQPGFTESTLAKYNVLKDKVRYFVKESYKRSDLLIEEVNINFLYKFWDFLILKGSMDKHGYYTKGMNEESSMGVIGRLKKVCKIAFREQGYLGNPLDSFKQKIHKNHRNPLSIEEVKMIMAKKFETERLRKVQDRLIIGVMTGLADSDIQKASPDMITQDIYGNKIINIYRTKTNELSIIPLWEPVIEIIERYKDNAELKNINRLFPQISNQKMNEYLAEIAEICGISKKITTHVLRHTYATLFLNYGGTLEGLAKILGHTNTNSTRIYAKRNMASVSEEAAGVKENMFKALFGKPEPDNKIDNIKKIG